MQAKTVCITQKKKKNPIESAKLRDLHEEQPQCDGNKQESEEEFDRRGSHFGKS